MAEKIFDPNMVRVEKEDENLIDWYEVTPEAFDIYGVLPEKDGLLTRRLPLEVAQKVNAGVLKMCGYGAGGRIVFETNSPFVSLKVEYGNGAVPTVCNYCYSYGFDLYKFGEDERDVFVGAYRPATKSFSTLEFSQKTNNNGETICYTLNMPHFSEVRKLQIGLEKGSYLGKRKKYRNEKPVVFYGSSITHGAAAGRPGNTYENFISQKYNLDYINLGFAGNARGEIAMAEYIAGLDMCVFVCDYDYNAPNAEHLLATHYPFYEIVRKKHPDIPYIMISKPNYFKSPELAEERRKVILESYYKALAAGDQNVYFIDGESLFEGEFYESCTSDGTHPNDLGFYRMANKIGAVIAEVLADKNI
ncbi:MAG: hypothetical protein IKJ74_04285 [Clostridia bacterium]|nr:hypothetical protein [Clostridia bacterium]